MTNGGITNKIQVLEETTYGDGGLTGEKVFGVTRRFEWNVDTSTVQSYALESSGPEADFNIDGVMNITGSHEWELTDGREFKAILGTIDDSSNNFDLSVSNALPSYTVKAVEDEENSTYIMIKGIKYTSFSLTVTRDETVVVTADWIGKTIEETSTFTPTVSSVEPLTYLHGCMKESGTAIAELDNFTIDITRNSVPRRFLECGNAARVISKIIEGPLNVSFNGEASAKRGLLENIWGSTGTMPSDSRSDETYIVTVARGNVNFNLTIGGGRQTTLGRTLEKSEEVTLASFSGIGKTITGSGSYE